MQTINGKGLVTDMKSLELASSIQNETPPEPTLPPTKKRKPATHQNKPVEIKLDLDAGSSRGKFNINGVWNDSFPGIFKEVVGELPSGISGCFSIGKKNFAVGQVANSLNGTLIEAFRNNKVKYLHIWLIGALTSHPDLLQQVADNRKYKGKPARLRVTLRLLSLSSSKRNDITKTLTGMEPFSYEGCVYEIEIINKDYLFPEGYGAALEASKLIPDGVTEFDVLDLGGGTLALSSYKIGQFPKAYEQTPASGGGVKAILDKLSIALGREDRGGIQCSLGVLQAALEMSRELEPGKHSVKYRHGGDTLEISDAVVAAMSEWVSDTPSVGALLTKVSQSLLRGRYVFATGGGFAISAVRDWIQEYVCRDVENAYFQVLDSPQNINLTGLRHLDH